MVILNLPKASDFVDTSFDTPELNVQDLVAIGYTHEQATAWLRKKKIQFLFEQDKRIEK